MTSHSPLDSRLLQRYDRHGPRYTSYPSAAHFSNKVGNTEFEQALLASGSAAGFLSAYVHVPFCESPCYYCACTRLITRQRGAVQTYLERLEHEIGLHSRFLTHSKPLQQLHLGGGTPTSFDSMQLARLMNTLDQIFGLVKAADREYSIEIDPRVLGPTTISDLARLGFNRVSLGVQDFEPAVQKAVNRLQSFTDTHETVTQARNAGFASVGMDLICGLPLQTEKSFARTLDQAIVLLPDRLSVYSYAHMPNHFKAQQRIRLVDLPSPALKVRMMTIAAEKLAEAGYVHIGMDHFALPGNELARASAEGRMQRNFQGYSTHAGLDLIGLGMSAISQVQGRYFQNARTLSDYYQTLDRGALPVSRGLAPSKDDQIRADVISGLMCQCKVDFAGVESRHCIDFPQYFGKELLALEPMQRDGLIEQDEKGICVTTTGRYLLRAIAMVFDRYVPQEDKDQRHSRVI